jgi:hypothetical protein
MFKKGKKDAFSTPLKNGPKDLTTSQIYDMLKY